MAGYHGELSADTLFIDGTKIESFANKYKFVWKKAVTRRLGKMMEEIPAFFWKRRHLSESASVMEMNCISGI